VKIFLCEPIHQEAYQILHKKYEMISSFDRLLECEIIISRNLKIDATFIEQCLSLKLIIIHGTGYNDVTTF